MSTDTGFDRVSVRLKRPLLYVMSVLYVSAGVMHFLSPEAFARIVPLRSPRPTVLV